VFWYLIKIPVVNTVFTFTTLTHYYRRYHQPKTKLKHLVPKKTMANKPLEKIVSKAEPYSAEK
jgi:hypothetical protein